MEPHRKLFFALAAAASLVACGGGGSETGDGGNAPPSEPTNSPPSIQNLRYSPSEMVYNTILGNATSNVEATLDYLDTEGTSDLESIVLSISTGESISVAVGQLVVSGTVISATIPVSIVQPATRTFTVRARDKAGNLSNPLQGTFKTTYETTFSVTTSQNSNKTTLVIGWGEGQPYPICARQLNKTLVLVSATRNGCGNINSFTATLPDGTITNWNSRLGSTCPGEDSTIAAGSPITLNTGMFTWIDSTTNSEFTLTFPNLMDVRVNCS